MTKPLYVIRIRPPSRKGYKYAVSYGKRFGDYEGGATEFKSRKELIQFLARKLKENGIIPGCLEFRSFTKEVRRMDLFGVRTLDKFGEVIR